jgi:hypothetical protein
MTRPELEKLATVLRHLREGRVAYSAALLAMLDLVDATEREHAVEDDVNASLEKASKGAGDDKRPV